MMLSPQVVPWYQVVLGVGLFLAVPAGIAAVIVAYLRLFDAD